MVEVSRTARVIQNAKVALFFYCINLILQFFSRKIFLDYLGAELLGLNTTAQNLLQFLNLAESGIGAAVAFALYKPLSQGNRQEIIDIVSLQGWFYRWVGLFVIAGSMVLMAFFPWIFAKADVPLIYAYGTFIAFLISALLGYFVNYKMIVLSADQKEYKITIETQSIKVGKVLIQMLTIWKLPNGYLWWMILEAAAAILTSVRLTYCIKNEYPWLVTDISKGKFLNKQYPELLLKIKQLFFHKIGSFVLWQSTPLVIYGFTSLTWVAIYGNYFILMVGCLMLVEAVFRGVNAGVGNLVVKCDVKLIKSVFWQIITARLFLAGMICSGIFSLSENFVILWVGEDYILPTSPLLVMTAIFFIQMSRTCDMFLSAYGLFKDIWAPFVESTLNVLLSILLGYFWGLTGIFLGVLISQLIIVNGWKPYFLYSQGFKFRFFEYIVLYTKKLSLLFMAILVSLYIYETLFDEFPINIANWLFSTFSFVLIYICIGAIIFTVFDSSFRLLIKKVFGFVF